ncbi:patatin-like phospholipase family protein [Pseudooceanicola aestuarii]|uniref:patatin-like phospholipase family protein n=1 Tax=Pseudooceanicola aestuarii TaxID=2697319 RepID=UPI0013D590A6|nr:patatin-like phospholipase family protein [Pseudooceanicola aestuarii]
MSANADVATWRRHLPASTLSRDLQFLALSGGGEDGAFGAGVLNGWSAAGTRPQFDIVTGISTGALIAPFAFLGTAHDATLRDIFLTHDSGDMMRMRTIGLAFSEAVYDTAPLAALIAHYTPPRLIRAVAARHAQGARLLVVTTNLETSQAVVWNMGAIAAAGDVTLFRAVLRASSAIPGLFPAVRIAFDRDGGRHHETHVDGGVIMQFLAFPEAAFDAGWPVSSGGTLHIVVNNTLDPAPQDVGSTPLGLSQQAITAMIRASAKAGVSTARKAAARNGLATRVASVAPEVGGTWRASDRFAADYMQRVYHHGYEAAQRGTCWR